MAGVDLREQVVVITGASAGIGATVAEMLAREGAALSLVARRAPELGAVAERCGQRAQAIIGDMTQREDVRRVVNQAIARHGRVDVWVNNVGRGISRPPSELTDEDIDEMIAVNVKPSLYGMQEILPHFKERGQGQIVNLSSILGRIPYALPRSAYSASKHFLNSLTANFQAEVQATHPGIVFSIVSPGVVRTDFGLNARHGGIDSRKLPDSQSVEEAAAVIVDVIRNRRKDVYTKAGVRKTIGEYYESLGEDP